MNQNKKLLLYLMKNGHIEPVAALHKLGIYRLSARILDLRKAGHVIETKLVRRVRANVAKYILRGTA